MQLGTVKHRGVTWDVWVGPAGPRVWGSDLEILFVPRRDAGQEPGPVQIIAATGAMRDALLEGVTDFDDDQLIELLDQAMAQRRAADAFRARSAIGK